MATIQQSIAISDGVTPQFQRMARAAEVTTGRFEMASAAANRVENAVSNTTTSRVQQIGTAGYSAATGLNAASVAANGVENAVSHTTGVQVHDINSAARSAAAGLDVASVSANNLRNNISNISNGFGRVQEAMNSTLGKFTLFSIVIATLTQIIGLIDRAKNKLLDLSDEYSGIVARIKLITSSQEQAVALNDQIYYSALRARGSYSGMADAVAKIGLTAKEAFPDPQVIVPFVENIQKLFTVGGTGLEQQKDAMLQLTQALGSGKLQGDEFRSIAEAAPMIEQIVAHFMGVTQGQLKQLSSDGKITADIMKNAILGATDEINTKFAAMPMTWGQVWQNMQTVAFRAFVPVFNQLSAIANSPAIKAFGDTFGIAAIFAGNAIAGIINNLRWLGGVAMEVGGYIGGWLSAGFVILQPVFEMITALAISFFILYAAGWLTAMAPIAAHLVMVGLEAMWIGILTAYTWMQNMALVAQNAELLISYVRIGIMTGAMGVWSLVTQGVTGVLRLLNLTLFMNPIGIVIALVLGAIAVFGAWAIHTMGLRTAIAAAFGAIGETAATTINFMIRRVNDLIGVLNKAATAINSVFHTNIGIVGTIGEVNPATWKQQGMDLANNFDINKVFSMPDMTPPAAPDVLGMGSTPADIGQNTKDTADNTGKVKEAMEITDEDIKYLRDIAEQEVINKYTTAEVKIEMGGIHNNVSSDTDIDGMVRYMNDSLFDAMNAGAEKVHP